MAGFQSEDLGIAASIFLSIYAIFFALMCVVVFKRGIATVYTFLWVFSLLRLGGQFCGVVYAKLGPSHWKWLIAYLVLGAEGYFTLIFAAFRFTCKAQLNEFGYSWVLSLGPGIKLFLLKRTFTWRELFHLILIPANVFVIAGGSMLAGLTGDDLKNQSKIHTSEGLRTTGQLLFVFMTLCAIFLNIYVYTKERVRNHITISVMCASPFLFVRGIFGVISIYVTAMNYFETSNYTNGGSSSRMVTIYEYVLSTTMEFIVACLLMSRVFFEHREMPVPMVESMMSDKEEA